MEQWLPPKYAPACNRFSIAIISSLIIVITSTSLRQNLKIIFCNSTYEVGIYLAFLFCIIIIIRLLLIIATIHVLHLHSVL